MSKKLIVLIFFFSIVIFYLTGYPRNQYCKYVFYSEPLYQKNILEEIELVEDVGVTLEDGQEVVLPSGSTYSAMIFSNDEIAISDDELGVVSTTLNSDQYIVVTVDNSAMIESHNAKVKEEADKAYEEYKNDTILWFASRVDNSSLIGALVVTLLYAGVTIVLSLKMKNRKDFWFVFIAMTVILIGFLLFLDLNPQVCYHNPLVVRV